MLTLQHILDEMTYEEYVQHLLEKYGAVPYDYFIDRSMLVKTGKKISRSVDGLEVHHIDETKYLFLSDPQACKDQNAPWECQKADRLVYCDKVEHLILHMKIIEEYRPRAEWIQYFELGPLDIIASINDLYTYFLEHATLQTTWYGNLTKKILPKYKEYILILNLIKLILEPLGVPEDRINALIFASHSSEGCHEKLINEVEHLDEKLLAYLENTNIDL